MFNFDVQRSPKVKSEAAPFLKIILMMSRNHIPSFVFLSQNAQFREFLFQIRSTIIGTLQQCGNIDISVEDKEYDKGMLKVNTK